MSFIQVEKLTIRNDRAVCDVYIPNKQYRYTTPELAKQAVAVYPSLLEHACVNKRDQVTSDSARQVQESPHEKPAAGTFASVIDCTSIPHLIEHLVIDLQVSHYEEQDIANNKTFTGTSEWTDRTQGRACIEVSFTDDLVVLRAFREAIHFLEQAVVK